MLRLLACRAAWLGPALPTIALDGGLPRLTARRRRRRPRRGSLARPDQRPALPGVVPRGRCSPLLPCSRSPSRGRCRSRSPPLPGSFDTDAALALANDLSSQYPDRDAGERRARSARWSWFGDQLPQQVVRARRRGRRPGTSASRGSARCAPRTSSRWRRAQSPDVIVVMAHRDDIGTGPGANDNASGTAALIELARAYAQPLAEGATHVASPSTIVFLSTDGGRVRRARRRPLRSRIRPTASASSRSSTSTRSPGKGRPSIEIARRRAALAEREPRRDHDRADRRADRLGAPPRRLPRPARRPRRSRTRCTSRARSSPPASPPSRSRRAATGRRRPSATAAAALDRAAARAARRGGAAAHRLARPGPRARARARRATSGSAAASCAAGRSSSSWSRCSCRSPSRSSISTRSAGATGSRCGPAFGSLRTRLLFWFFVGLVFTCFRLLGAWPTGVGAAAGSRHRHRGRLAGVGAPRPARRRRAPAGRSRGRASRCGGRSRPRRRSPATRSRSWRCSSWR